MKKSDKDFIAYVEKKLKEPLPGQAAQHRMGLKARIRNEKRYGIPKEHRKAAVLNLLHWEDGAWRTVLMRRTVNPKDRHSGQISFPGGSMESVDKNKPVLTALREAEEEIGVSAANIRILGALTDLYIPVSNFMVYPFVGVLLEKTTFVPQESEALEIIQPTLDVFKNKGNIKQKDMEFGERRFLKNVPYYDVHGHIVWGATAMMLAEFMALMEG